MTLAVGQIVQNRYRIVKHLGQGGFSQVYRAWDLNLGRACAVKENLETSPEAQKQFFREAQILANLNHPNLARVADHFSVPGQGQYLVMDYVDGEDLQQILDSGGAPLAEDQVLPWIDQVCEALIYLHEQNPPVIHRDIKPANIKITSDGKAYLVDFGIAKIYDPQMRTTLGARAVTPGYSPPEQYGMGDTDQRTDEYALGATLYCLLTGSEPLESIQRTQNDNLNPPRQLVPSISPHVAAAIQRSMQLDVGQRFQSIASFRQALYADAGGVTPAGAARAAGAIVPGSITAIKDRPGLLAATLILLVIVIGAFFLVRAGTFQIFTIQSQRAAASLPDLPTGTAVLKASSSEVSPEQGQSSGAVPPAAAAGPTADLSPSPAPPPIISPTPSPQPSPTSSVTPALPSILVEPYCAMFDQSPAYVKEHQPVRMWWRWDARTAEQVRDQISAGVYTILLDGERVDAQEMSEVEYLSNEGFYRVSWYADVGNLEPGRHLAERYLDWTRKISDGWNTFGPGGEISTEHDTCEIIVR